MTNPTGILPPHLCDQSANIGIIPTQHNAEAAPTGHFSRIRDDALPVEYWDETIGDFRVPVKPATGEHGRTSVETAVEQRTSERFQSEA
jgi:hypothetical protein